MGLSLVIPVANNHAIDQVIEQFPRHPKFSNIPPNRDGDSTKNAANVLFVKVSQQKLEEFDSTTNLQAKKNLSKTTIQNPPVIPGVWHP